MVSLKIRNFRFWVLCLGTENMGLIFVFDALVVWGVWNLVLSFVFRPIWDWIQVFWVLNFMFIFSKSMVEDPWPKPHGRRSMAETHLDRDLIFSLSLNPDGHRGLMWVAHDCVLVYFIDEDWLWVLVFLVFCFLSDCVLGFFFFVLLLLFWLSVLGFVSWLC